MLTAMAFRVVESFLWKHGRSRRFTYGRMLSPIFQRVQQNDRREQLDLDSIRKLNNSGNGSF